MNEAQASKIHGRLLAVGKALNEVDEAIAELDKEDRAALSEPSIDMWVILHSRALREIYARHPQLRPIPEGVDEIDCDLHWGDVTLTPPLAEADLDAVIISKLRPRSLKVAKIIGDVWEVYEERGQTIDSQIIGARIRWLAEADRIASFGDVRYWRSSEIALKERGHRG
jgi:hypothetical protein